MTPPRDLEKQAKALLRGIAEEGALERMIPNDAAWALLEEAESLAQAVIAESDVITVYRRMEAAAAGARAERDIMRAAVEAIAAGAPDPVVLAQDALNADRARRRANADALRAKASNPNDSQEQT